MHSKTSNEIADGNPDFDKKLIAQLVKGRDQALNELMKRYKGKLFSFIFRYVQNEDVASDILQETFIRVYTRAHTFKPEFAVSTWIYQIALNLCRDWARKQKLTKLISLNLYVGQDKSIPIEDLIADPLGDVEEQIHNRRLLALLETEIQKLPHKLKSALILFTIEGHSQQRCAEILKVTPKTVEMRVYRARKILSQKMPSNILRDFP